MDSSQFWENSCLRPKFIQSSCSPDTRSVYSSNSSQNYGKSSSDANIRWGCYPPLWYVRTWNSGNPSSYIYLFIFLFFNAHCLPAGCTKSLQTNWPALSVLGSRMGYIVNYITVWLHSPATQQNAAESWYWLSVTREVILVTLTFTLKQHICIFVVFHSSYTFRPEDNYFRLAWV